MNNSRIQKHEYMALSVELRITAPCAIDLRLNWLAPSKRPSHKRLAAPNVEREQAVLSRLRSAEASCSSAAADAAFLQMLKCTPDASRASMGVVKRFADAGGRDEDRTLGPLQMQACSGELLFEDRPHRGEVRWL